MLPAVWNFVSSAKWESSEAANSSGGKAFEVEFLTAGSGCCIFPAFLGMAVSARTPDGDSVPAALFAGAGVLIVACGCACTPAIGCSETTDIFFGVIGATVVGPAHCHQAAMPAPIRAAAPQKNHKKGLRLRSTGISRSRMRCMSAQPRSARFDSVCVCLLFMIVGVVRRGCWAVGLLGC